MHAYRGPERRRHRIFRTHNTEYHCRDDLCVAVRDVSTGAFLSDHPALGLRMTGGIRFTRGGAVQSVSRRGENPHLGETLFFSDGSPDFAVRTTPLERIERPPKDTVQSYQL
jgi:hypothetical protein